MYASVRSARIAPKKANLIAKLVRGMSVPDAVDALSHTHKKGARIIEDLLRSAIANAGHNMRQDPQTMVISEIVVNQAQALHRGVPMARGRARPIRKFMSHIHVKLGYPEIKETKKSRGNASQNSKNAVQKKSGTVSQKVPQKKTSSQSSLTSDSSLSS